MSALPAHPKRRYMRDVVEIGQRWRRRGDGAIIVVRQIHRPDRQVQVVYEAALALATYPKAHVLSFAELRKSFDLLVDVEREVL